MYETTDNKQRKNKTVKSVRPQKEQGLSDQDRKTLSKFGNYGFEFVCVVSLFGFFGYKADQYFESLPWFTVGAILFAITGLVYQFVKDLGNLD